MTQFVICNNPDNLEAFLREKVSVTVEAEYGDRCVNGSFLTLAHHGPRAHNPAPCLAENDLCAETEVDIIALSHLDLDSLGGCAAIIGEKPTDSSFWQLAAFIDVNGLHKLNRAKADPADVKRLYAYLAWQEKNPVLPARDGSVTDITNQVLEAMEIIHAILWDKPYLIRAGKEYAEAQALLNTTSFIEETDGVIMRFADKFCNHLYTTPEGKICRSVVAFNEATKAITVSFDSANGFSAAQIVKNLWGELAGGHPGIAGSPRGQIMNNFDLVVAREAVIATLLGK